MKSAFEAFVIAVLIVAVLTPLVRILAFRIGAVAHPGGRHVHQHSIPRLGGVGICVAFYAPLLVLYFLKADVGSMLGQIPQRVAGLVVGGVAMCGVGVVDDTRGIKAIHKLLLQIAVAIAAFKCGFTITAIHLPIFGDLPMGIFALPVTVLWFVGVINAVNLIDGLDGLAAGVVFFAAATNFVVAYLSDAAIPALLSCATLGAVFGFLFYNFNPARIFMGDSGSYFLGFVLAASALMGTSQKASTAVSLLVPVMALGVPIFDTLFAMVRRVLERRSVFSPDRGHLHHRLLDMGITHRRAVILIYAVCGVFTVAAIGVSLGRTWHVGVALLIASAAFIGLVRFVGYFEVSHLRGRQKARIRSRDSEMLRYALPRVPAAFSSADSEAELFDALDAFAREADLGFVDVVDAADDRSLHRWSIHPGEEPAAMRDLVSARYPLGRDPVARTALKFGWQSDFGDVTPQSEILLQVVADVLTTNLARLGSPLAPRAATSEAPASDPLPAPPALAARHSRY